ncbi:hypothetical protein PR048_000886 [Dryococelus australis]|uniref:Uncharacterized protein n=1 Tax=Dryococelus australis TaxID=614101 RepID=A0ABQ9IFV4_9NEOP|nr:hypothetical protein PR048_000886 [Dryococelus australis]
MRGVGVRESGYTSVKLHGQWETSSRVVKAAKSDCIAFPTTHKQQYWRCGVCKYFHGGLCIDDRCMKRQLHSPLRCATCASSTPARQSHLHCTDAHSPQTSLSFASHQGDPGLIPGRVTLGFSLMEVAPDDAAGRRVFTEISRFSRPCIPTLLYTAPRTPSVAERGQSTGQRILSKITPEIQSAEGQGRTSRDRIIAVAYGWLVEARFFGGFGSSYFGSTQLDGLPEKAQRLRSLTLRAYAYVFGESTANRVRFPDFRMRKSWQMMQLVGGFSRGSPVPPVPSFRRCSILTLIKLISQDLAIKSCPNIFTQSLDIQYEATAEWGRNGSAPRKPIAQLKRQPRLPPTYEDQGDPARSRTRFALGRRAPPLPL